MRSTRRDFMKFLDDYVTDFRANVQQLPLADLIAKIKAAYDVRIGGNPQTAFQAFVNFYNSLGDAQTKAQYAISSNLARNLPGALMQDWLVHLALQLVVTRPELFIFTEVRVLFGTYPPGGQVKVLHPWPGQNPPPLRRGDG
jgi:hypothetical protein